MRGDAKLKCRRPEKIFQCLINVYLTPCLRCPLRNELRHLKRFSGYDKWNYDGDWSKTRIQLVSYVVLTLPEVVHGNCVGPITVKNVVSAQYCCWRSFFLFRCRNIFGCFSRRANGPRNYRFDAIVLPCGFCLSPLPVSPNNSLIFSGDLNTNCWA